MSIKNRMSVVVSGIGCVSQFGNGPDKLYDAFLKGESNFSDITLTGLSSKIISVGKIMNKTLKNTESGPSINSSIASLSLIQAIEDAGICELNEFGLLIANNDGNSDLLYSENDECIELAGPISGYLGSSLIANLREVTHSHGFSSIIYNTCAAYNSALEKGVQLIEEGVHDTVIVGGADGLMPKVLNGFDTLRVVNKVACKPFSSDRKFITISEGSAFTVIQRSDIAKKRYCEIKGSFRNNDAIHKTSPNYDGVLSCHEGVLSQCNINSNEVQALFLHGTGTILNDKTEAEVYSHLGYDCVTYAPKKVLGHHMATCGAMAAILICMSYKYGFKSSCNIENNEFTTLFQPKPAQYLNRVETVQSNSFGFGGNNAIVIFGR